MAAGGRPQRGLAFRSPLKSNRRRSSFSILSSHLVPVHKRSVLRWFRRRDLECVIVLLIVSVNTDSLLSDYLVVCKSCKPVRTYTQKPRRGLNCS